MIVGRTLLEIKGNIPCIISDNIVAANDPSQSGNELFVVKILSYF